MFGIDNVLWGGSVADSADMREDTEAIRALNAALATDDRVTVSYGAHWGRADFGAEAVANSSR